MVVVTALNASDIDRRIPSEAAACEDTTEPRVSNEGGRRKSEKRRSSLLGRLLFQTDEDIRTKTSMGKQQQQAVAPEKVRKSRSLPTCATGEMANSRSRRGSEEKKPRKFGSRLGRAARRSFLKNKSLAASELTLRLSLRWGDDASLCDDDVEEEEEAVVSESRSQSLPIDLEVTRAPVVDAVVNNPSSSPDSSPDGCCVYEAPLNDERGHPAPYDGSKGTHPMFDGRFIEADDGRISLDPSWQEGRRQSRPVTRRGGRRPRPSALEQKA